MRSLTICQVFLLLCAVGNATYCEVSETEGLHYKWPKWTCSGGENKMMAVKVGTQLYHSIECHVWRPDDFSEPSHRNKWIGYISKWAHKPSTEYFLDNNIKSTLHASCVEYCASKLGEGVKRRVGNKEWEVEGKMIEISCADNSLRLYRGQKMVRRWAVAECHLDRGWTIVDDETIYDVTTPQHFECKKAPVCSFEFRYTNAFTKPHFDDATKTLACDDEEKTVAVSINRTWTRVPALNCDEVDGWKDGEKKIAEADIPLYAICTKVIPCEVQPTEGAIVKNSKLFESAEQHDTTLSCAGSNNNSLRAIEYKSKRYVRLKCSDSGRWKNDGYGDDFVEENDVTLKANCVEYCASTGTGIRTIQGERKPYVSVQCSEHQLYYGDQHLPNGARCSLDDGWENYRSYEVIQVDTATPLQLDCRPAPTTTTQSTDVSTTTTTLSTDSVSTTTAKDSTTEDSAFTESTAQALEKDSTLLIVSCAAGGIFILVIIIIIILCIRSRNTGGNNRLETDREDTPDIPDNVVSSAPSEQ